MRRTVRWCTAYLLDEKSSGIEFQQAKVGRTKGFVKNNRLLVGHEASEAMMWMPTKRYERYFNQMKSLSILGQASQWFFRKAHLDAPTFSRSRRQPKSNQIWQATPLLFGLKIEATPSFKGVGVKYHWWEDFPQSLTLSNLKPLIIKLRAGCFFMVTEWEVCLD